jgi:hypothetical protein
MILTVDSNVGDHRQASEKIKGTRGDAEPGIRDGPFTEHPPYHDASQNWRDLEWIRDITGGIPIYLKGVSSIEVRFLQSLTIWTFDVNVIPLFLSFHRMFV